MTSESIFADLLINDNPQAIAWISGSETTPELNGRVKFFNTPFGGVLVEAQVFGLPSQTLLPMINNSNIDNEFIYSDNINNSNTNSNNLNNAMSIGQFYGIHIHENGDCTPPFDKTGNHYNPTNTMHPYHAGDMVSLLGNNGFAYQVFYDKRFSTQEIIGKSVIIHSNMDDFMSQPSGNSGSKIGCGVIRRF